MVFEIFQQGRSEPTLRSPRLVIRPPRRSDWREWAQLRALSRDHLTQWEPTWAADTLTRAAFRRRLDRYAADWVQDRGYAFFIFREDDMALMGGVTLSNVRRGVAQSCAMGYWMGLPFVGNGFMTEAVVTAADFCYDQLSLHRVEAACLPHNVASRSVLLRAGFSQEGIARKYLRINGRWQDHLLFSKLREDRDPV